MAVFNTNQNRQFYVAKAIAATPAKLGDLKIGVTNDKQLYFQHYGRGGLTRTDLINVSNICYAKITKAAELQRKLKMALVSLDANVNGGKPIAGQDYILRVIIKNYLAWGDDNVAIKHGAVHATAAMAENKKLFYDKLAESLTMNFSREVQPLLTFTSSESGVVITEVEQPYVVGFMAQEPVNFEVVATTITYNGDDVVWATTDSKGMIPVTEEGSVVKGGPKIADLEYFCMGERGDQYRDWVAMPKRLPVKYMVDPTKEYNVLDIHYFFSDTGVNVHKSEKDITLVVESTDTTVFAAIKTKLTELGVTVQGKTASNA